MNINQRFQEIIDNLFSGNKRAFSRAIGVSSSVVENIVGKRQGNPSFEVTNKLISAIANINAEWLLTGKGTMLKVPYTAKGDEVNVISEKDILYRINNEGDSQIIPLYNLGASEGLLSLFDSTSEKCKIEEFYIPNAPKCDGAIYARGDGMSPILQSGDIVCYKIVRNHGNILWGEMYLMEIETEGEQYITIKYIQKSDRGDSHILLVSQNPTHDSIEIATDSIKALAHIKVCVRYNSIS